MGLPRFLCVFLLQFAYLAFLVLFSYVILVRQENIPSISEVVLIIFVCTLFTEEIRQVTTHEIFTVQFKTCKKSSKALSFLYGENSTRETA